MKMNKVKTTILVSVILSVFVISTYTVTPVKTDAIDPFFTLVAKTNGGGVRPDYLNFFKQHVAKIGINVDVIVQDWPTFVGELIAFRDFDVCFVALSGGGADPDFTGVYNENGSLNLFGYHTSMDDGLNEAYMKNGTLIMPPDSAERVAHYWEWEQYLMDKILPCQPVFAPRAYTAYWSNLDGWDIDDGILQSWGKMEFTGLHTGQIDDTEIVIHDAAWSDLNPFFQDDTSSSFISSATMDPLIWYDEDLSVWPHLAKSYTMLNDTHLRIRTRDGIPWQQDPDGLFPDEEFDAEDVYFTLYAWKTVSVRYTNYVWIKDIKLINSTTVDIFIDGNPATPENDPFAPFLPRIAVRIQPEHYLNQTQLADGKTPDVTHPSWSTFATKCFGTGLFEFDSFTQGVETSLTLFQDSWRMDPLVTNDPLLNWEERFGFATGFVPLQSMRIRIIPDQQTALLEYEAGKLDIFGVTQFPDKRDAFIASPNHEVQDTITFYFSFFGYNMRPVRVQVGDRDPSEIDPTISKGLALRKAMSYALDRVEMNDVVHKGEYIITDHPIYLKFGIWCNPNIIRYNHDLGLAREFMAKAGYDIPIDTTPGVPGFTLLATLASILAISTVTLLIVKRRK